MDTKRLTSTQETLPIELPLLRYERIAAQLRDQAVTDFVRRLGEQLMDLWIKGAPATIRESRQQAMHPDKPRAENLHELGLERFLRPSA